MERKPIQSFHDLLVWQHAHALALLVYTTTKSFPKEELFSLTSQMRQCAISMTSNIAEGFARAGKKEKIQFYFIARGSLTELENQLLLSRDIGYLKRATWEIAQKEISNVHKLLNAFIRTTKNW